MLRIRRAADAYVLEEETADGSRTQRVPIDGAEDVRRLAQKYALVFEDTASSRDASEAPVLHLPNATDIEYYDAVQERRVTRADLKRIRDMAARTCKDIASDDSDARFRGASTPSFHGQKNMRDITHYSAGLKDRSVCTDVSICASKTERGRTILDKVRTAAEVASSGVKMGSHIDEVQERFVSALAVELGCSKTEARKRVPFDVVNRIGAQRFVQAPTGLLLPGHIVSFGPNYSDEHGYVLERRPYAVGFDKPIDLTDGAYDRARRELKARD